MINQKKEKRKSNSQFPVRLIHFILFHQIDPSNIHFHFIFRFRYYYKIYNFIYNFHSNQTILSKMRFFTNQLLFGLILAAFSLNLGNAFTCHNGYSTVYKSGDTKKDWDTTTCGPGMTQCLKFECENDLSKTVQVMCGNDHKRDCTKSFKTNQDFGGNCPFHVGEKPAAVTKCTSCNSDNCWGTSALPAPEYPKPPTQPAPKSNEKETPAPTPTEAEAAAASNVPIIGAIGLVAIGAVVVLLGGIH